jgi:gamma-glutamyl:cysteine ligase YbdK (ATP-grasp superfamily)
LSGLVVPEPVSTRDEYERRILQPIYDDLAPHDPEGILRYEWANARGAIARFDRDTIEIRVLDIQETPRADLAIAALVSACLRKLVAGDWLDARQQNAFSTRSLADILAACVRDADAAPIADEAYLAAFGAGNARNAGELWQQLYQRSDAGDGPFAPTLRLLLEQGCLARRIARALGEDPTRARIDAVYRQLSAALLADELFDAHSL